MSVTSKSHVANVVDVIIVRRPNWDEKIQIPWLKSQYAVGNLAYLGNIGLSKFSLVSLNLTLGIPSIWGIRYGIILFNEKSLDVGS